MGWSVLLESCGIYDRSASLCTMFIGTVCWWCITIQQCSFGTGDQSIQHFNRASQLLILGPEWLSWHGSSFSGPQGVHTLKWYLPSRRYIIIEGIRPINIHKHLPGVNQLSKKPLSCPALVGQHTTDQWCHRVSKSEAVTTPCCWSVQRYTYQWTMKIKQVSRQMPRSSSSCQNQGIAMPYIPQVAGSKHRSLSTKRGCPWAFTEFASNGSPFKLKFWSTRWLERAREQRGLLAADRQQFQ